MGSCSKWISVKDRLPETEKIVLLAGKNHWTGEDLFMIAWVDKRGKWLCDDSEQQDIDCWGMDATHWAYLRAPREVQT